VRELASESLYADDGPEDDEPSDEAVGTG